MIANVTRQLQAEDFEQIPVGCVAPLACDVTQQRSQPLPIYYVDAQETDQAPAEAVIQEVSGDRAMIWLGGSDPRSLTTYRAGAQFRVPGADDPSPITVIRRTGLMAEVNVPRGLAAGTLLQEAARVVPRNTTLRIGLDPSLREQASEAQTAFEGLGDRFELVLPPNDGKNATRR